MEAMTHLLICSIIYSIGFTIVAINCSIIIFKQGHMSIRDLLVAIAFA